MTATPEPSIAGRSWRFCLGYSTWPCTPGCDGWPRTLLLAQTSPINPDRSDSPGRSPGESTLPWIKRNKTEDQNAVAAKGTSQNRRQATQAIYFHAPDGRSVTPHWSTSTAQYPEPRSRATEDQSPCPDGHGDSINRGSMNAVPHQICSSGTSNGLSTQALVILTSPFRPQPGCTLHIHDALVVHGPGVAREESTRGEP